jgi:uncharacterized protein
MVLEAPILDKIHANLANSFQRPVGIITKTLDLFHEGNTVPFVARYRKELTANMDEVALRDLQQAFTSEVNLEERRITIVNSITEQGKMTDELAQKIAEAVTLSELEDLYLPYKPKRQTKAQKAREAGLEPLADLIAKEQPVEGDRESILQGFVNSEAGYTNEDDVLGGAMEIIIENVSEEAEARKVLREIVSFESTLQSKAIAVPTETEINDDGTPVEPEEPKDEFSHDSGKKNRDKYKDYFDFSMNIQKLKQHQIMAINRGENEGFLDVELQINEAEFLTSMKKDAVRNAAGIFAPELEKSVEKGVSRMIRTVKREEWVKKIQDAKVHSIRVFSENLGKLLLQQPLKGRRIFGVDPGYRAGCKCAIIDETGKFLEKLTVYPHPPQSKAKEAKRDMLDLARKHNAFTFAIGNGTASRETEALIADMAQEEPKIEYTMVNESGASVYSASDLAREEFPDLDVNIRSAVSIARRLQDPLSELIKIDAKSIGVGQYQHDVDQGQLGDALDGVVDDCVNKVGVDVNVASVELLKHVSGLNARVAKEIVNKRDTDGKFIKREELQEVKFLGDKTYEQSVGFLKIYDGVNPLDSTFIHPESYTVAEKILESIDANPADLADPAKAGAIAAKLDATEVIPKFEDVAGEATLKDIVSALKAPRRDPRDDLPPVILKKEVLNAEDLKVGMILKGTVRNVLDFGAFIDIGVKYNGLIHVSELSATQFVKDPNSVISVGDVVEVMVKELDLSRKRIQLSIKMLQQSRGQGAPPRAQSPPRERRGGQGGQDQGPRRDHGPRPDRHQDRPLQSQPNISFKQKQSKKKE